MRNFVKYCSVVLSFLIWLLPITAFAMPKILTTEQLRPGMIGMARTVVQGNQIKSFNVKIIGVEDNGKGAPRQIMAKAYGPMMQDTNGVIHGMSGSPVYVDGYLIGAVARGIGSDTNPHVFYITPIQDMLALWDMPDNRANTKKVKQIKISLESHKAEVLKEEKELDKIWKKDTTEKKCIKKSVAKANAATEEEFNKVQFVDTKGWKKNYGVQKETKLKGESIPLAVNGFSSIGMEYLKKELAPFNMYPYMMSTASGNSDDDSLVGKADLKPGSSVGVAIAYGDFSVGAVGTITAIDGDKILAFGHPFTYRGNVNYFMTNAAIIGTASGLVNGQKVSSFGKIIGRINQDRYAGVSGITGQYPQVVPVRVTVDDKQLNKHEVFGTNIAYDEELIPNLTAGITYASLDRAIDSLSAGTANVKFEIMTDAVPSGKVVCSNMYYNGTDVGQFAVSDLAQVLDIICSDPNKEYDITGVEAQISFNEARKTASIISIVPDKSIVYPGERVNFKLTLQPYRAPREQLLIPYIVPKNQIAGNMTIEARGGGLIPVSALALQGVDLSPEENKTLTAADKINTFLQTDKNNEIIVDRVVPPIKNEKEQKKAIEDAVKMQQKMEKNGQLGNKNAAVDRVKASTNYVIDNVVRINLKVKEIK
ncbi:SpoIVB peptidase S55 domain-containing protein [Pectinatus sottacetonis]|uniref:SpoIVB peptidase S55 domain-containing protein n=1 Tax=Pectinatus sottacetonis TaxID=1002795 RepID=UPI0018C523E2|nr:SpoIVB peptidase S55 domain-containing protein [Pectinatus sottacetonis]